MSEMIFAFDRDWTVDVNPHPQHQAVPLEWVRHLAHETEHRVYAIGNQDLVEEAEIPGVAEIVDRHPDDNHEWLGDLRESGRWERFPTRRERLGLLADLHPDADARVVVDDIDLSDVSGWDHYHAWDFVPAVERGDLDPDLPWVNEPVTDGGLPYPKGIEPVTASEMQSFLDMYGQSAGYELAYNDEEGQRAVQVYGCTPIKRTFDRPAAADSLKCYPVDPNTEVFTVQVDEILGLDPVDLDSTAFRKAADTPAAEATGLGRLAEIEPGEVPLPGLLGLLEQENVDDNTRHLTLKALRTLASSRPEDCTAAVPIIRSLLERDELSLLALRPALRTLRHVGDHDAEAVAPLVEELRPYLDANIDGPPRDIARIYAEVGEVYPEDLVGAVPDLGTLVEEGRKGQGFAVYALSAISRDDPTVLEPIVETLGEALVDDTLSDGMRLNAGAAFGRYVGQSPEVGVRFVDDLVDVLDVEDEKLRNNAIGVIGDVAQRHTDVVEPHVDQLEPLLEAEDRFTRINASATLSRVAEDFPDTVGHMTETFLELLEDEESLVRTNACWALGHLEAEEAVEALENIAHGDENQDVRNRAAWAHAQILGPATESVSQ